MLQLIALPAHRKGSMLAPKVNSRRNGWGEKLKDSEGITKKGKKEIRIKKRGTHSDLSPTNNGSGVVHTADRPGRKEIRPAKKL